MGYPYGAHTDALMGPILALCRHAGWVHVLQTIDIIIIINTSPPPL